MGTTDNYVDYQQKISLLTTTGVKTVYVGLRKGGRGYSNQVCCRESRLHKLLSLKSTATCRKVASLLCFLRPSTISSRRPPFSSPRNFYLSSVSGFWSSSVGDHPTVLHFPPTQIDVWLFRLLYFRFHALNQFKRYFYSPNLTTRTTIQY
jgi:hypothetical protein